MSKEEANNIVSLNAEVTDDNNDSPPAVPYPVRTSSMYPALYLYRIYAGTDVYKGSDLSTTTILPKWVYIRDRNGRYLTIRPGPQYATLTFRTGGPDQDCVFEAIRTASLWYRFLGRTGGHIMRYYSDPGWYSSDGTTTPSFNIITSNGNIVYLKDNYGPSRFFSNELRDTGAPIARDSINESCRMEIQQAALRNEITDIQYDIPRGTVRELPPLIVFTSSFRNNSSGDLVQTITYSYQKWAVGTWNNVAGVELGVKATFTAAVPFVANANFDIAVSAPSLHEWGGKEGVRKTVTSSASITVPARKRGTANIIVRNAQIDVPFTYRQRIEWANGQVEVSQKNGIYNNIDSWQVDVELKWEDI